MQELTSTLEEDLDWSLDPNSLRDSYKQTNFEPIFYKLISKDVIKILSPQLVAEPHNLVYDEDLIYANLINPLERFICGLDEDATQEEIYKTFEHLQTLNQPSKVCRRVLKTGDVTFSCNDCGLDETCVVCIDCFHKGAHKDHNYRMANSNGGCCDCGDVEAWKQNYACTDHQAANQTILSLSDFETKELRTNQIKEDKENILKRISSLPKGIASRYFTICQASLNYARLMFSWKNYHSLPQCLQVDTTQDAELAQLLSNETTSKNYFTVVYNDEVHTYDFVISTFVQLIKCTKMQAGIMAATVSREGRCFINNDTEKACRPLRNSIANTRDNIQGALKVEVIHGSILAHQAYALKLIEWIRKMSSSCDAFRILTAYTLLGKHEAIPECDEPYNSAETLVEKIMCYNTTWWKIVRVEWNELLVISMLTEYSIKQQLARLMTRIYPKLMQDFIEDDHDHSVSILTMTTQLYTVPSLICMLIEEEDALSIITQTFLDVCRKSKRDPALSFENRKTFEMTNLKRGFYIVGDLRNLINVQPTKWTEQLRRNVVKAVKIFLNILSMMQGMDSVKRQSGQHLEYEPDWESGMTLQSRLTNFITRLVTYCSYDNEVLVATLKETQSRLLKVAGCYKHITSKELFGHQVNCIQYDVSVQPVSVHLPLSRFAAALMIELMARRPSDKVPYDESLVILTEPTKEGETRKYSMIDIMEASLRTEVMIAQFRSGMWRRNGYSLVNQILYFHAAIMGKEMYDRDILLLQECAAMCDANEFMMHLLNKFQLFDWVSSDLIREPLIGPKAVIFQNDEEIMAQIMSLGEEFLQLLLTIVGERYRKNLGLVEEQDVIKNEMIQLLCISPYTRSDILQKLGLSDHEADCIKAVANLRRSTESSTGKYELKDEFYDRFNPFFYHYSRRNQSNAIDAQLKRKKNLKEPLICCPPPPPVGLCKQFSNLNELLKCDITLTLIAKILSRALGPPENAQECSTRATIRYMASDLQLDQCLHLIGLGLFEQERNPIEFRYLQTANKKNIFALLKECYEKAKRSKDLIFWLMKKTNNLVSTLNGKFSDILTDNDRETLDSIRECFRNVLSVCDTLKQDNKKKSSELAAQRRERIMTMMKANQNKFLCNPTTKQLVAETEKGDSPQSKTTTTTATASARVIPSSTSKQKPNLVEEQQQPDEPMLDSDLDVDYMECDPVKMPDSRYLCILCRDDQTLGFDKPTMVLLAFVQRSSVLSKNRGQRRIPNYDLTPSNQVNLQLLSSQGTRNNPLFNKLAEPRMYSFTSDNSLFFDATIMPSDLFFGPHISTCGHSMHYHCWKEFFAAILKRETSRPNRNARHVSFELEKHEFLCPLCEFICNTTIPLLPNYTNFAQRSIKRDAKKNSVFSANREVIARSSENLSACLLALRSTVDVSEHIRQLEDSNSGFFAQKYMKVLIPKNINEVLQELNESEALGLRDFINSIKTNELSASICSESLLSSISTLAERINYIGLDLHKSVIKPQCDRIFMMTTWTISYTIQVYERVSRFRGSPIFEDLESSRNFCLSSLLRFACASMLSHHQYLMRSLLIKKLRYLLINEEHLSSSPCCLDIDALEMFVSLFILLQKLYTNVDEPSQKSKNDSMDSSKSEESSASIGSIGYESAARALDHEYFRNLLHLMLILNMLQVVVSIQNESPTNSHEGVKKSNDNDNDNDDGGDGVNNEEEEEKMENKDLGGQQANLEKECLYLHNFYQEVLIASGHPIKRIPQVNSEFCSKVRRRLLPFLRSCAIFFYHLSHIPPPDWLRNKTAFIDGKQFLDPEQAARVQQRTFVHNGNMATFISSNNPADEDEDESNVDYAASDGEFEAICQYLDLPNDFSILFQSLEARHLARSWLRHPRVLILIRAALKEREDRRRKESTDRRSDLRRGASSCSLSGVGGASSSKSTLIYNQSSSSLLASSSSARSTDNIEQQQQQQQQQAKKIYPDSELMPVKLVKQPHSVNRLIELPYDYSELVDKVSDFTCPSIKNEDSRTPTLCLVCGVMLCSQSYCCQRDLNELASNHDRTADPIRDTTSRIFSPDIPAPPQMSTFHQQLVGSCTHHAYECSGGVGVFLRIRNCQILLLSGRSKGCYLAAPYIDDHGETDFGLTRGNPLHLNREHFEKLQQMWLTHAIPEHISRTLESSPIASSIHWHLH